MKSRASCNASSLYRGRFAPSPNGPLHFGSLIAAVASFLDARAHDGQWLLRIDDIDGPRVAPGARDAILRQLEGFGFEWNRQVEQSRRLDIYQDHFQRLKAGRWVYPCQCSRKQVFARHPQGIYDGHCRRHPPVRLQKPPAWRLRLAQSEARFTDLIQGERHCHCLEEVGEFVIKRADGIWGYHFVCAIDEITLGITHVIRGADLLHGSFAQRLLIQTLESEPPAYGHHPIAVNAQGIKLSKRARSEPIRPERAGLQLWQALRFLGQQPPDDLRAAPTQALWQWAFVHYRREKIPAKLQHHDPETA